MDADSTAMGTSSTEGTTGVDAGTSENNSIDGVNSDQTPDAETGNVGKQDSQLNFDFDGDSFDFGL